MPVKQSPGFRWRGAAPFLFFFVRESIRGGWDVARRVLDPRLPLAPGFVRFTTSLPRGPALHLFVTAVTLLPGTVTAGIDGDRIIVHTIDSTRGPESGLRDLERRVSELFVQERKAEA